MAANAFVLSHNSKPSQVIEICLSKKQTSSYLVKMWFRKAQIWQELVIIDLHRHMPRTGAERWESRVSLSNSKRSEATLMPTLPASTKPLVNKTCKNSKRYHIHRWQELVELQLQRGIRGASKKEAWKPRHSRTKQQQEWHHRTRKMYQAQRVTAGKKSGTRLHHSKAQWLRKLAFSAVSLASLARRSDKLPQARRLAPSRYQAPQVHSATARHSSPYRWTVKVAVADQGSMTTSHPSSIRAQRWPGATRTNTLELVHTNELEKERQDELATNIWKLKMCINKIFWN